MNHHFQKYVKKKINKKYNKYTRPYLQIYILTFNDSFDKVVIIDNVKTKKKVIIKIKNIFFLYFTFFLLSTMVRT